MKNIKYSLVAVLFVLFSCDTEYLDPNSTLEPELVESVENLSKLINGVQQRWSTDRSGPIYNLTTLSGLNTGELRLLNPGNLAENDALLGGSNIDGGNDLINNLWTVALLCKKDASTVLKAADEAAQDPSDAETLKAYALYYTALVNGTLIQYFEEIPLIIEVDAPFEDRSTVLMDAISNLDEANQLIMSGLSSTIQSQVFSSIDLPNAINALLARYHLMAANYQNAIAAADRVDLSKRSVWEFDDAIPNPLAFWFGSQNVTQAKDQTFGLADDNLPETADQRVSFYVNINDPDQTIPDFQVSGFWKSNTDVLPVYLPGEIGLIKAESYARMNDLNSAIDELNQIRTKTTDVFGLGAALGPYSGPMTSEDILDDIYKNRRVELYLTGLSLEDSRRFNRPGPEDQNPERNRNFYPYSNNERDNNQNTPPNPRI